MNDPTLTTHRTTEYTYTLLNHQDEEITRLDGITGGSATLSATTRLRARGVLSMVENGQMIRWKSDRVRVDVHVTSSRGVKEWPVGVFLLAAPKLRYVDGGTRREVELLGKLVILDEDRVEHTYSVAAGVNVIEQVIALLASVGERRVSSTPSDSVTASMMTWEAGTSKLTIVNELLASINYWSLWVDGAGVFRVEPYVRPGDRSPAWSFQEGESSIHLPEWERDQDLSGVPNRVVLVGQGSEETPALVGVAQNEDPVSPFSYQSRGRWVTFSEQGVEAADQATLTDLARRKLIDLSTPTATMSVTFMPLPLDPNDVAEWESQGHRARAAIRELKYSFEPDALCAAELVEVVGI